MAAHARLSPSSAERWMACPGSVQLIEQLALPDTSSVFADEGTAAHDVRATCLELGINAADMIGHVLWVNDAPYVCDADMAFYLQPGIDELREIRGDLYVETKVPLGGVLGKRQFGTLDAAVYDASAKTVYINDLKYGQGVPVEPVDSEGNGNPQLLLYAIGFIDGFLKGRPVEKIVLWIDQPRCPRGGGRWELTLDYLEEFRKLVAMKAQQTLALEPVFQAGDKQCQWCPVRLHCGEFTRFNLEALDLKFDDLDIAKPLPARPPLLTKEKRSALVLQSSTITKWLTDLSGACYADAMSGEEVPGMKLVLGNRGDRKWRDERAAASWLLGMLPRKECYTEKLVSPAQAEKKIPKEQRARLTEDAEGVVPLVVRSDAMPILVAESDRRKPVAAVQDMFDDLDADGDTDVDELLR